MTDTVGFVSNLPHHLVAAFRATLEEVVDADVLVHVVDISHPDWPDQVDAVHDVLEQLGAAEKPTITAYNKIDRVEDRASIQSLVTETPNAVGISARTGQGVDDLLHRVEETLAARLVPVEVTIPYRRGDLVALCYERGRVRSREDGAEGVRLRVDLPAHLAAQIKDQVAA